MKIGFYIHTGSKTHFSGVENKIRNQIKVLSCYYDMYEVIIEKEDTSIAKSVLWRLPGGSWGARYEEAISEINEVIGKRGKPSFFYIRISPLDTKYIEFLKVLRSRFSESKMLLEIPTYPYDQEYLQNVTMMPWYFKEKIQKGKLSRLIDRIITVSDCGESIWDIPVITAFNGVDVDNLPQIKTERIKGDETIRMLAVAQFQPSHGYERVIHGLASYYANGGDREVELHLVGEGEEYGLYRRKVDSLRMNNRVFFYGTLSGNALDECYDNKDIGLGEFGLYKRGLNESGSLKVREYLAKGLPVVSGVHNNAFDKDGNSFCIEFENNSKEIDIIEIIRWYDGLMSEYGERLKLSENIREFAKNTVDMKITMRPIIEYLQEE